MSAVLTFYLFSLHPRGLVIKNFDSCRVLATLAFVQTFPGRALRRIRATYWSSVVSLVPRTRRTETTSEIGEHATIG